MTEFIVQKESLDAVADAIRTKGGTDASLTFPQGFVDAVGAIESGGGGAEEFTGIKWLKVNSNGYPTRAEAKGMRRLDWLFYNTNVSGNYREVEEIIIPSALTEIGFSAFTYCKKLKSISDISDVTVLKEACFDRCASLVIDELPPKLQEIGRFSFRECTSTQYTTIPASVKSISAGAFNAGWKNSNSITFKGTPNSIDSQAFMNNSNVTDIYVPWAEGAVTNAPWGATNATIHYNSEV